MANPPEEQSAFTSPSLPEPISQEAPSVLAGKRVVIVEDEGMIQLQLRRALTRGGMIVAGIANNGVSGVEVVLRERPDLALMDIRMPGEIDGLEAAQRILAEYPLCIVMITAYATEEYQQRANEIGASGYLLKPIISESLLAHLERIYTEYGG